MSGLDAVPGQDVSRETLAAAARTDVSHLAGSHIPKKTVEYEGSLASHLLYGLGTLLFVLPLFIPDISMFWLTIGYGSLIGVLALALVSWAAVNSWRGRRRKY